MYLLFGWDTYYPSGGPNDFCGTLTNLPTTWEEASKACSPSTCSYEHYRIYTFNGSGFTLISTLHKPDYPSDED